MWRKTEIRDRLVGKPHLKPVYTHVFNIPERLKFNDRNLFVVFNMITERYEIHSLVNKGNSFSLTVPYERLDARVEDYVRKYDIRRHGRKIFRDIDEHNEMIEREIIRDRRNRAEGLASELHKPMRRLAWEVT